MNFRSFGDQKLSNDPNETKQSLKETFDDVVFLFNDAVGISDASKHLANSIDNVAKPAMEHILNAAKNNVNKIII